MSYTFKDKQKSLKRRFLLILGLVAFTCFFILGLMVMFWDGIAQQLPGYQRKIFGGLILLYAIIRFARLLRKEENE